MLGLLLIQKFSEENRDKKLPIALINRRKEVKHVLLEILLQEFARKDRFYC